VSQQLLSLVGIRKTRFSKQRKWLMKGEIEDSHRHKATNMQTSQESTILMAIYGSLWDISTLTNESTLSQGLCSQMKKKSIYISIVCSSSLGSACMEVRLRVVPAYQVKPASHFASQSFSFLLPFGLAIGAFMPAIFALYFARRGPFVAHLKVH